MFQRCGTYRWMLRGRKYDKITGGKAIERVTRKSRFIAIRVAAIRHVSAKNLFCDGDPSNAIKHNPCVHCNKANGRIYGHFAPRSIVKSSSRHADFEHAVTISFPILSLNFYTFCSR